MATTQQQNENASHGMSLQHGEVIIRGATLGDFVRNPLLVDHTHPRQHLLDIQG
jgi:hypothetical protein